MAIGQKLMLRQSQTLAMTPQILQAIKLLQLSHAELQAFIDSEIERNPLLERAKLREDTLTAAEPASDTLGADPPTQIGDWAAHEAPTSREALERESGTSFENAFPDDPGAFGTPPASLLWREGGKSGHAPLDADDAGIEAFCAQESTLITHLQHQLACTDTDDLTRNIALHLLDQIEPTGYLADPLEAIAERLAVPLPRVELALSILQTFEPVGVCARSLAECLELQLRDKNRFDPAMAALMANLDRVAARDFATLRKVCEVDPEDLADMLAELRALDPKPGLRFGGSPTATVVPDVFVRATREGGWQVELNPDTMPRVVANRAFYARVLGVADNREIKTFLDEAWSSASWIARSLDQRARTILRVASEIVRQQDAFFTYGIEHLRPMTLKQVGEAVELHESTISRVTANKFMTTPRGLFEMKYFFASGLAQEGSEGIAAETVRHRIRLLVDAEAAHAVLSDDAIAEKLSASGIDVARRTIAKYREAMGIPSSAIRRREKMARHPHRKAG